MKRPARTIRRLLLLSTLIVLGASVAGSGPVSPKISAIGEQRLQVSDGGVRYMFPEVRLRKLHLVRPDLIIYPIDYDVYC
jgi:hypothetical protein